MDEYKPVKLCNISHAFPVLMSVTSMEIAMAFPFLFIEREYSPLHAVPPIIWALPDVEEFSALMLRLLVSPATGSASVGKVRG